MSILVNKEFEMGTMKPLKNDEGKVVDKYIPRKCAATSKIIGPKDHASVQIFIPEVDENGRVKFDSGFKFAISGYIREKSRSDYEIEKLLKSKGVYPLQE